MNNRERFRWISSPRSWALGFALLALAPATHIALMVYFAAGMGKNPAPVLERLLPAIGVVAVVTGFSAAFGAMIGGLMQMCAPGDESGTEDEETWPDSRDT